jgi:hypothetical protein
LVVRVAQRLLALGLAFVRKGSLAERGMHLLGDLLVPLTVVHRHGPGTLGLSKTDVVVVTLVRDGEAYVQSFVKHYLDKGVSHLVFMDNGSVDQTVPSLADAGERVTILSCQLPFGLFKRSMRRYMASRFGRDCWVLMVDIDEFFDFPFSSILSLADVVGYLNNEGYSAVTLQMLDLCTSGVANSPPEGEEDDLANHRFYDISALEKRPFRRSDKRLGSRTSRENAEIKLHYGGAWHSLLGIRPLRTKHSLFFPSRGVEILDAHYIRGARVADFSAVLYHYKFIRGFRERARRAAAGPHSVTSGAYWNQLSERLDEAQGISLPPERATELKDVDQLVNQGFLMISNRYKDLAGRAAQKVDQTPPEK